MGGSGVGVGDGEVSVAGSGFCMVVGAGAGCIIVVACVVGEIDAVGGVAKCADSFLWRWCRTKKYTANTASTKIPRPMSAASTGEIIWRFNCTVSCIGSPLPATLIVRDTLVCLPRTATLCSPALRLLRVTMPRSSVASCGPLSTITGTLPTGLPALSTTVIVTD